MSFPDCCAVVFSSLGTLEGVPICTHLNSPSALHTWTLYAWTAIVPSFSEILVRFERILERDVSVCQVIYPDAIISVEWLLMLLSACQSRAGFHIGQWRKSWYLFVALYIAFSTTAERNLQSSSSKTHCLLFEITVTGNGGWASAEPRTVLWKFTESLSKSFDQILAVGATLTLVWVLWKMQMGIAHHLSSPCIYSTVEFKTCSSFL